MFYASVLLDKLKPVGVINCPAVLNCSLTRLLCLIVDLDDALNDLRTERNGILRHVDAIEV